MLAILIINFLIVHLVPGDPVQALVGDFPTPPGYIEQVRQEFGLDQPIAHQLGLYLWNLAQGNLGFSFANRQPVLGLILDRGAPDASADASRPHARSDAGRRVRPRGSPACRQRLRQHA